MALKIPFASAEDLIAEQFRQQRPTDQDFMMALAVMKDQGRLSDPEMAQQARDAAAATTAAGAMGIQGYRGDLKVNRPKPPITNPDINTDEPMPGATSPWTGESK